MTPQPRAVPAQRRPSPSIREWVRFTFANDKWDAKKLTFPQVADQLEQFVDRPVVDQTNLVGSYDFMLDMTREEAFEKLGVSLVPKKVAQPVLVVDSVAKQPTEY